MAVRDAGVRGRRVGLGFVGAWVRCGVVRGGDEMLRKIWGMCEMMELKRWVSVESGSLVLGFGVRR